MNYINYLNERTKAGELMDGFKPLINVYAPRRSNMVMLYRWYAVAVCILAVAALWSKLA